MKTNLKSTLYSIAIVVGLVSCNIPKISNRNVNSNTPKQFLSNSESVSPDTANSGKEKWAIFFKDSNLISLIDTALHNNQELNILMQEINIAQYDVARKKGAYLPFVRLGGASGVEKVGRYTSQGANDANTDIKPGVKMPDPLQDFAGGMNFTWEVDIWKKLRNARKASINRYLATVEGKNFMVTHLVSEIAKTYYELEALDNQLEILKRNIAIQQNALEVVRLEKTAARVTELAVKKFEAEVFKNQSHVFYLQQQIVETENRLNYLVGRFPQPVKRSSQQFSQLATNQFHAGQVSDLISNRPDIKKANFELIATKWELASAKAEFYPSLMLLGGMGFQAFKPSYLFQTPQSLAYQLAGELAGPLLNRNAIKANYLSVNSAQIQAAYRFDQVYLNAFMEVSNQLSKISNLQQSYALKLNQVETLTQSIDIANTLFKSARADYMEVLMTQRDAVESNFELVELKRDQMQGLIDLYQALGGGWR